MLNEEELGYEVEYTLDYEYRFYEAKVLKVERARGKARFRRLRNPLSAMW